MRRALLPILLLTALAGLQAQEVQLERCDKLLLIPVSVAGKPMHFLVDTAATTLLNLDSFQHWGSKADQVSISSWDTTLSTSARRVTLPETLIGNYRLDGLELPAVDLSAIGRACGKRVDGIVGADLLEKMGAQIDVAKQIAHLTTAEETRDQQLIDEMMRDMHPCRSLFQKGDEVALRECFDPNIIFYTSQGEFHGREAVVGYLRDQYFKHPERKVDFSESKFHRIGDAVWYEYVSTLITPERTVQVRGMAMCHRQDGRWRIGSMHHALVEMHANPASPPLAAIPADAHAH